MAKEPIHTDQAPPALGPYSQGIVASGSLIFTAGQLGLDPQTSEFASDEIQGQTRQALTNLGAVLKTAGADFKDVVKVTVFLADMNSFGKMNEVYQEFFPAPYPARSALAVKDLPLGGLVEIEMVAVKPD